VSQTVRGVIFDQATRQPLAGALVQIMDIKPTLGAISDSTGSFFMTKVPVGRYQLRISYIGYKTLLRGSVLVNTGQETVLEIGMDAQAIDGDMVVIEADQRKVTNEAAMVSARSFSAEELRRIPGGIDDPSRTAVKFPGVTPTGFALSNELNVRGNTSRAVIWRLEGIDIYNPNHFATLGGTGGSVTLFSQQLLTNTDFFSGAFPADYGNALGGVFDARFKNGNTQKRQHSVQLSFLGVDLATEGPFSSSGKSSYLANYRYSTTGIVGQFLTVGAIPTFQDFSFKLHFQLPNAATVNVFGIGGISLTDLPPNQDTTQWADDARANFGSLSRTQTGTMGLTYSQPVGENSFFQTGILGTGIRVFQERFFQRTDLITADTILRSDDSEFRVSWTSFLNHKFSSRHTHRTGVTVHGLSSDIFYVQANNLFNQATNTDLVDTLRRGTGQSLLVNAYSRSQFILTPSLQVNAGLHLMYLALSGEVSLEPRLGIRYQLNPKQSLSFWYGLHSQMEPFFAYIVQRRNSAGDLFRFNEDLRFNKAHHLVLSYKWQFNESLRLGVEVYYQSQFNLVVGENLPISRVGGIDLEFETKDLNNGGTGRNMGIEFALERNFAQGYYFLVNGSLFDATYVANDGIRRNARNNARVVGNIIVGKEWKLGKKRGKANLLNVNLSASYAGPQYFSPVDLEAANAKGIYQTDFLNPNTLQQDPLTFLDGSLVYQRNRPKRSIQWSIQVRNILNQQPLISQAYNQDAQEVIDFFGSGIVPILAWRIQF